MRCLIKIYGVIGDPIAQSMSPIMHNQEIESCQIHAVYHPFHIKPENLQQAIAGMKAIGIQGFNVTAPHKTAIMPLLDSIDPLAKAIGAVNTVVREEDGSYRGYNTDGNGYIASLQEAWKEDLTNERVLIIGAGGAARAIYYSLVAKGVKNVDICNRSIDNAQKLIDECPYAGHSQALSLQIAEEKLDQYSLIIQTTSIGMYPNILESPIKIDQLSSDAFVSDIIYNPFETQILKEAKQKGAGIQNGLGMFVYQGALAFEYWFNREPNTERMEKIVAEQLGGK